MMGFDIRYQVVDIRYYVIEDMDLIMRVRGWKSQF
jgi:hypothetical protein